MRREAKIEAAIYDLLGRRAADASICPSDVARALEDDWRPLMPAIRRIAARLADRGDLVVTQGGHPIDARDPRGPVRLRLPGAHPRAQT